MTATVLVTLDKLRPKVEKFLLVCIQGSCGDKQWSRKVGIVTGSMISGRDRSSAEEDKTNTQSMNPVPKSPVSYTRPRTSERIVSPTVVCIIWLQRVHLTKERTLDD